MSVHGVSPRDTPVVDTRHAGFAGDPVAGMLSALKPNDIDHVVDTRSLLIGSGSECVQTRTKDDTSSAARVSPYPQDHLSHISRALSHFVRWVPTVTHSL